MRHHQTRRKGRNLKKRTRTTRRRQQGGAAISSINDWFKAISDFESRKSEMGTNYLFASLADPGLVLPSSVSEDAINNYIIRGVNNSYPPYPLPSDYKAPDPVDMNLIEVAQIITYLFNGENDGGGLLNMGYTTLQTFMQYVNNVRSIPDNTTDSRGYGNKRTVWFLNEIEKALQSTSGADRGFTSIYDTPKLPFYILYLVANPVTLPSNPELEKLPPDVAKQFISMQPEPSVPAT